MSLEIEHKYLVKNDNYRKMSVKSSHTIQGYLSRMPERTVRIRIKDDIAFLTIKGKNSGAVRKEFEYEIPITDAKELISMCEPPVIEKIRHIVPFSSHTWEVDEFLGSRKGLVTAEIELGDPDEIYDIPDFVGENVTGNPIYYNSNL